MQDNPDHALPTEAIILAGGLGTRLRSVVHDVPKPMAPVHGRPFLEYILSYWIDQGIKTFVLSVAHLSGVIQSHFGATYQGACIRYVDEGHPLGTGGALRKTLLYGQLTGAYVVVLNGDTWYQVVLADLIKAAIQGQRPITMALKPFENTGRYGHIDLDTHGHVIRFGSPAGQDKIGQASLINGGCYAMEVRTVRQDIQDFPESFSLEHGFLVPLSQKKKIAAHIQDGPFLDIGIPDDYHAASRLLLPL